MDRSPTPLDAATSARLRRQPRSDTKPEAALRRELHRRGLRFRLNHPGLPGRPDIVFTRAKVAVFVDGCFWHRCPEHSTVPRNNRDWWQAKFDRNTARDRAKDAELAALGWRVLHVWEHEATGAAADRVEAAWRHRVKSRSAGSHRDRTSHPGSGNG
ncbi:very short patch repair endonuclease [Saccharomonospora piscinae]|nr:very short patch repair endonuclease [Saccharomonospora piscinae]TLW92409.1 very short patch repair endonuclease [Saccharomonospora piscinae]